VAYASRHDYRFVDPARQGRFEAMVRDLAGVPLLVATRAVDERRVLLDGRPYAWEADPMVYWLERAPEPRRPERVEAREGAHFRLVQGATGEGAEGEGAAGSVAAPSAGSKLPTSSK
jgi:hypothetical protein